MKPLLFASLLAVSAAAQDAPKLLSPNEADGAPVNYRMIYLHVPAGTAARIEVQLADAGECFDTSILSWTKSMADKKRVHALNFDGGTSTTKGKKPEGCPRRKLNHGRLHTVDLPAEKGGMLAVITYREGQEVLATLGKLPPVVGSPAGPAAEPTPVSGSGR